MTRGQTPSPSLSSEDILTLTEIRRDIWLNSARGFVVGGASSYLMHRVAVFANSKKWITMNLNRSTAFASFMLGASLGSFLFATAEGKNSVHNLHPIFERGAKKLAVPNDNVAASNYEKSLQLRRTSPFGDNSRQPASRQELERNRIIRRASLHGSMQEGHGLNDSHGGHWVKDEFRKE